MVMATGRYENREEEGEEESNRSKKFAFVPWPALCSSLFVFFSDPQYSAKSTTQIPGDTNNTLHAPVYFHLPQQQ